MSNAIEFISAFNIIDSRMRAIYRGKGNLQFSDLVRRCAEFQMTIRKYEEDLQLAKTQGLTTQVEFLYTEEDKIYADALLNVNKESFIDFSDYRKKEALEYRVETLLLYRGNPDLTDCYQEYHSIANAFASRNIRVLLPKPYPLSYFDDFPITGICEFDSETKTKLDYQVSAEEFAAIHCLKHYRINLDKPVETYFMQRNQYSISSDKGVKKKGRRR